MQTSPRETVTFKELARVLQHWLDRQAQTLDVRDREQLFARLAERLAVIDARLQQGDSLEAERLLRVLLIDMKLLGETRSASPGDSTDPSRGEPMGNTRVPLQAGGRLSSLLDKLRPRKQAAPLCTYPTVLAPRSVRPQTVFSVEVAAQAQTSVDGSQKVSFERAHEDSPVDVELSLQLPAGSALQARGPLSAVLRICPDGRAAKVVFELYASEVGSHSLAVVFRYDGVERFRMKHAIHVTEVVQPQPLPAPQIALSLGIDSSRPFGGLILSLTEQARSSDQRHFDVVLSGPAWGGRALRERMSLPADANELVTKLCRDMERALRVGDWTSRENSMQGIGSDLANRILPRSLQDALLAERWLAGTPLHIESDDVWIPWEALFLGSPIGTRGGRSGFFVGEHFAVTRWLRTGSAREQVGGASAVMIAPTNSGLSVGKERAVLAEVTGQAPLDLADLSDVQGCLRGNPRAQVLHFACHGQSKADAAIGEALILQDGELHATDIPLANPGELGSLEGTLVFLNACQAGIEQRGLWRHGGWASKLLDAGAGAVVAPSWTVTDAGAMGFAEHFYRNAKMGMSLSEAARQARRAIAHTGNLDRIGYALYAAPTAIACFETESMDSGDAPGSLA